MNNEVNTLFMGDNNLNLVEKENIVLKSETQLNDNEKKILSKIFTIVKQNEFRSRYVLLSLEDVSEEVLIDLQGKRVILINMDRKEYVLTQWYKMKVNKGANNVALELDETVCEYFRLFPSNYLN